MGSHNALVPHIGVLQIALRQVVVLQCGVLRGLVPQCEALEDLVHQIGVHQIALRQVVVLQYGVLPNASH
jgi:hypothetical protein